MEFELGRVYRRRDIHDRYGGQRQGGISTSRGCPVIFLFTGATGRDHGYGYDGWQDTGLFDYTGEGQPARGDMTFTGGNRAIRDHVADGKRLLLFQQLPKHGHTRGMVRFLGEMVCVDWRIEPRDAAGNPRQVIVFTLAPAATISPGELAPSGAPPQKAPDRLWTMQLDELRQRAYQPVRSAASLQKQVRNTYRRSEAVKVYVLRRAAGVCEACGQPAPFTTETGQPFLEPHHIRRLADGGPDDPRWVAAVCPNCHREAHYGQQRDRLNRELEAKIAAKEAR